MEYLVARARGLFQYRDLAGSGGATEETQLDVEGTGILSANAKVRRSRRCMWITTLAFLLLAVVIIAAAVKNRQHLKAAADALMKSVEDSGEQAKTMEDEPANPDVGVKSAQRTRIPYKLRDFVRSSYYARGFNGTWISHKEILFRDSNLGLSITNVETQVTRTVVSHNQAKNLHPIDFTFSADRSYLLVKTSSQRVWRRSSIGSYALVRMNSDGRPTSQAFKLLPPHAEDGGDDMNQFLRFVSWAPVGNALAYVDYENNIHYRHSAEAKDNQLTTNGVEDVIFNGIPDWVNEEEVFEDNKAIYWSPDGTKLVYGVFNDTQVEVVKLPRYGNWKKDGFNSQNYPFLQYFIFDDFRYPKVGATNPSVSVILANVGPPGVSSPVKFYELPPPESLEDAEYHYTFVRWPSNSTVAVNWMNRIQNKTAINICDVADQVQCQEKYMYEEHNGWVDYHFDIVFNPYNARRQFLTIKPSKTEPRYRQLFLVNIESNQRTFLTAGQFEVTKILKWTREDHVYYLATKEGDPGARHLFRLSLANPRAECLTCNTQEMMPQLRHREKCEFVDVKMSKDGSFYVMDCKGPGIPYSCLHHTATNTLLSVWSDNAALENRYSLLESATVRYEKVPVPGTNQQANVVLFMPPGADSGKKFPLLIDVYGGPGFQVVDKKWAGSSYGAFMSAGEGIIYARIDPRGSGFQGDAWRHAVYRQFGTFEATDTIHVTKYLQDNLPMVDRDRTAIWGWSYGGFLALSVLTQDTEHVFACGASVAPVVRWELYDTYYTERYMSTLDDNPEGYRNSTPLRGITNLRGKQYLVVHGTHDDNVHYQQSMMLAAALEEKDILFRQQSYPDQDHSIAHYTKHLYHTLTNFFTEECFKQET